MKKLFYIFIISCILVSICIPEANAQGGSLDFSFGSGGIATTAISSQQCGANAIAIQTDGSIVVAGYVYIGPGNYDFAVVRYTSNGSLDNTFGIGGIVTTDIGTGEDRAKAVAIQSDGKIVVAGYSDYLGDYDFALARYNINGTLDNSFSTDGKVLTDFGSSDEWVYGLAIQNDGKIVVTGRYDNGTGVDIALARYNSDGSLDATFGLGGKVITSIQTGNDVGRSVLIQPDGKILVAGSAYIVSDDDFAVVRYTTNGNLDNTFDGDGIKTTDFSLTTDYGYSMVLQPDGKILVAGSTLGASNPDFAMVRYNSSGSMDASFGTSGKVITDFLSANEYANSIALKTDGKIVIGGVAGSNFALACYEADGSLDGAFGIGGMVSTNISGDPLNDEIYAVAIQSDGKVVVAGYTDGGIARAIALARYHATYIGLDESSPEYKIHVFPNPSMSEVKVSVEKNLIDACFILKDATGQQLIKMDHLYGTDFSFDISEMASGIYFIEIIESGKTSLMKLIRN